MVSQPVIDASQRVIAELGAHGGAMKPRALMDALHQEGLTTQDVRRAIQLAISQDRVRVDSQLRLKVAEAA